MLNIQLFSTTTRFLESDFDEDDSTDEFEEDIEETEEFNTNNTKATKQKWVEHSQGIKKPVHLKKVPKKQEEKPPVKPTEVKPENKVVEQTQVQIEDEKPFEGVILGGIRPVKKQSFIVEDSVDQNDSNDELKVEHEELTTKEINFKDKLKVVQVNIPQKVSVSSNETAPHIPKTIIDEFDEPTDPEKDEVFMKNITLPVEEQKSSDVEPTEETPVELPTIIQKVELNIPQKQPNVTQTETTTPVEKKYPRYKIPPKTESKPVSAPAPTPALESKPAATPEPVSVPKPVAVSVPAPTPAQPSQSKPQPQPKSHQIPKAQGDLETPSAAGPPSHNTTVAITDSKPAHSQEKTHVVTPEEVNDYVVTVAFFLGCFLVVCIIFTAITIICIKVIIWCFFSPAKNSYAQFENEQTEPNPKNFGAGSFKPTDEDAITQFRNNELRGEMDPTIFYKNEYSRDHNGNHRVVDLRLDLESQPEDKSTAKRMEYEHQRQLNNLDLDFDVSSKYSHDNSEKPEIEVSFSSPN